MSIRLLHPFGVDRAFPTTLRNEKRDCSYISQSTQNEFVVDVWSKQKTEYRRRGSKRCSNFGTRLFSRRTIQILAQDRNVLCLDISHHHTPLLDFRFYHRTWCRDLPVLSNRWICNSTSEHTLHVCLDLLGDFVNVRWILVLRTQTNMAMGLENKNTSY